MLAIKSLHSRQALLSNGGNFILFHLLWLAAIFGAVQGSSLWALAVLALQLLHGAWVAPFRRDVLIVLSGLLVGLCFEIALIASGLIEYRLQSSSWAPPLWILVLWAGFAQAFNHSLAWLQQRLLLAGVAGGVASMVSLYAGLRFGAATSPQTLVLLAVYGLSWSLMVPLLAWLAERNNGKRSKLGSSSIVYD